MLKVLILLVAFAVATPAWTETMGIGVGTSGTMRVTVGCTSTSGGDECTKSDLVLSMRHKDKLVLIRGVYDCLKLSSLLAVSSDVASVECYRQQ